MIATEKRRISITDVAKVANVSKTTVSLVMNKKSGRIPISEESIDRVRRVASELGYKPNIFARGLVSGRSHVRSLAVILPSTKILNGETNSAVFWGVNSKAAELGYIITLVIPEVCPQQRFQEHPIFKEQLVEGVIAFGWDKMGHDCLKELEEKNIPFAAVHMEPVSCAIQPILSINSDDLANGVIAAEHLLQCGYQEMIFVGGPENSYFAEKRRAGVRDCLKKHGREMPPANFIKGDYVDADMEQLLKVLSLCKRPVGILAASDFLAAKLLKVLKQAGASVPTEAGVIGFDDEQHSQYLDPALTTIRLFGYREGEAAAQMVTDLIGGKKPEASRILIPGELVVRESTAKVA